MRRRFCLLLAFLVLAAPVSAAGYVRGVDVSHWKGRIDWSRVALGGYRFAFAEASNGFAVDWTYARNRTGAKRSGMLFGAFHFARPGGSTLLGVIADAIAEARFFVSVARPQAGELAPVLDLERTGGLTPAALRAWTAAWLDEVETRIGARPTIYASPTFWRRAMGDASVFAATGSHLWVAHWHVRAPRVPAANWDASGWTFWQWTNCSFVPGIRGCVDGDRFRGPTIAAAALAPRPTSLTPPLLLGVPQAGETLSATPGTWQADPAPTFAYRWERCDARGGSCAVIADAVTSTYTVAANDFGAALRVVVTATSRRRSASAGSTPIVVNG